MPVLIERVVRDISDQAPDVLVVTGDLVDTPFYGMTDPECLEQARKDQQLIRETIDPIDCPVFYLFGNHDHPDVFKDVFSDQSLDVTIGEYRFVSFYDEEVTDHFAERVGEEKERFDHVLTDADPTPQIHLQHYMVWPENNKGYPHSYREASELKAQIAASGKVVLSLSGHFHGGVDAFADDATWFATSRAFCEPPHPYRIYNLEGNHVEQTEYALGSQSANRALFLDIFGLQDPLRNDTTTRAAVTDLREDGWLLIGIANAREHEAAASERACDDFVGELSALGFNLDAVVSRRSVKNTESEHYHRALDQLDIEASTSRALVCTEHEAEIAKSAGIKVIRSDPANLIQTLGEATEH
jgi:Icc-related predicted phosphoesterase